MKVNLPPGCEGVNMEDGTRYDARRGGAVMVADEHAAAVQAYSGGDAAILNGSFRAFGGTKNGRWCQPCRRLWNAWNDACVKCGGETIPEAEMPRAAQALPSGCTPVAAGISGPLPGTAA